MRSSRWRRLAPWLHPPLLAAAPVLALYAANAAEVEPARVLGVALASMGAAALLTALSARLLGGVERGALAASLLALLFFSYGHVFDLVLARGVSARFVHLHAALGAAWVAIFFWGARRLRRARAPLDELTRAATIMAVVLVGVSAARLPRAVARSGGGERPRGAAAARALAPTPLPPAAPDVYFIVLDGYARADVLQRVFEFDNQPFLDELARRGFFVADRSLANYTQTYLSLASTLNMTYIRPPRAESSAQQQNPRLPYYRAIQNPVVANVFRSRGYRYVHFATNYGGTETSRTADEVVPFRPWWLRGEFLSVLFRSTALRPFEPSLGAAYRRMFDRLDRQPARPGPKLVFAHFTLPHNPYVFDRDGNEREDIPLELQWTEKTGGWLNRTAYVEQLQFVNRRVLATIDALLAGSAVRPVIVLQSDHGSAVTLPEGKRRDSPKHFVVFLWERLSILNAWLVPDAMRPALRPDLTPVNTFRILANEILGSEAELLADRHYYSWYEDDAILDVTAIAPRRAPVAKSRRPAG